ESLDKMIERNVQWLTDYQDASYADQYQEAVARIREAEASLSTSRGLRLTRAVAKYLAKLMAYKDTYEVARLYADAAFADKLRAQFEGEPGKDYKLHFHLAPPLLARKNANGELVKKKYGPWIMPMFRL